MKITHKVTGEGQENRNDLTILHIVTIGLMVFVIISSISIFLGLSSFLEPYLATYSAAWRNFILGAAFVLGCLLPDTLNSAITMYLTSQTYDRRIFATSSDIVISVFFGVLLMGLTYYSFTTSRMAGEKEAREITGEADTEDVTAIDSTYFLQNAQLDSTRQQVRAKIEAQFEAQQAAALSPIVAKQTEEEAEIARLEKKRDESNTDWVDRQQKRARKRITALKGKEAKIVADYSARAEAAVTVALAPYGETAGLLKESYTANRGKTVTENEGKEQVHASLSAVFINQLRGLSGYAVFAVLILSIIQRLMRKRNGIQPAPIFEAFDFQPSPIMEVISLPFVWCGRHIINYARRTYNGMERVIPRTDRIVYDTPDVIQEIREFDALEESRRHGGGLKAPKPSTAKKIGTATANGSPFKTTNGQPNEHNGSPLLTAAVNGQNPNGQPTAKARPTNGEPTTTAKKINGQPTAKKNGKKTAKQTPNGEPLPSSKRRVYLTGTCLECNNEFEARTHNKKFCSATCKKEHHAKKHNGVPFDPQHIYNN